MQTDNSQPAHCRVAGCIAVANRKGAGLCEKHYTRQRRHGSTDKAVVVKPGLLNHSHGYTMAYAPEHPLRRDSSCRVYEHRRVYHAQHGDGPFNCNWCSTVVGWDDLHVDHLNDVKDDNTPSNLVASCATCNQKRGFSKMARDSPAEVQPALHSAWEDDVPHRVGALFEPVPQCAGVPAECWLEAGGRVLPKEGHVGTTKPCSTRRYNMKWLRLGPFDRFWRDLHGFGAK
ncbi:HNH endonuclease [Pseudomonas syringae]|uniref:HNH endonuclease n=1 Tax=Pseudomonas syringae TaxID=317 RepID=UPI000A4AAE1B|nr:HNH endonuclease signature motif containing protein [Pseudomonas syringae]